MRKMQLWKRLNASTLEEGLLLREVASLLGDFGFWEGYPEENFFQEAPDNPKEMLLYYICWKG